MAKDNELFQQLTAASVINEGAIYRMRLFSPEERRVLRKALAIEALPYTIEGGAGMMDELEMVNFQVHGKTEIKRAI